MDKRTAALSKMKLPSSFTASTASWPGSHREPASTKNAPCIPMLSGTNGKGKRTSAVVAQNSSPPRESCEQFRYALSGVRIFAGIAWTVAGALEPTDRLAALEEEIGQADIELRVPRTANHSDDVKWATAAMTRQFEEWVREMPEQWMWSNRRWK